MNRAYWILWGPSRRDLLATARIQNKDWTRQTRVASMGQWTIAYRFMAVTP
jgi:hypothetical protein